MARRNVSVCHLTSVHPVFDHRIFEKECRSLSLGGYDVTLVACHERDETVHGVRILALPRPTNRFARITATRKRLTQRAREVDADLYHFHDPELLPVGVALAAEGRRVLYDVHEDVSRDLRTRHYLPRPLRPAIAEAVGGVERLAVRRLSGVVAATPHIGERLRSSALDLEVVRNYPTLRDFGPPPAISWSARESAVAYAGLLDASRGIGQLIDAMSIVNERRSTTLLLAGPFSPQTFRRCVVDRTGWRYVEEQGVLGRAELRAMLARSRVGVVLAEPLPNTIHSITNKLFEYMAAGVPVISSDFPQWRSAIEESGCGLILSSLDPKEIASAIEELLGDSRTAEEMGRRGREAVESRFNWERESHALFTLYQRVLARAGTA